MKQLWRMMKFELLNTTQQDGQTFDCGVKTLNVYLQQKLVDRQPMGLTRLYVLTVQHKIIGYYALSAHSVPTNVLPVHNVMERYHEAPFLLLERLAVDKAYQKQGYGSSLIVHAFKVTEKLAEKSGILGMIVNACDERAACFYQKFGFNVLANNKNRLVLPFSALPAI